MIASAKRVQRKVLGKSYEDFLADENLQDAVLRRLGIIGEAASKISSQTREQIASVPWDLIVRMRNVLVHVYLGVDLNIAWSTATHDMEPLIDAISTFLGPDQPANP